MDYRHTEAFARELEAAALRAEGLRQHAIDAFWHAVAGGARRLWRRLLRTCRIHTLLPEA
jgi:hypothetical protein